MPRRPSPKVALTDLFYAMNKEAAGHDLGLTLQAGRSPRRLIALSSSDKFRLCGFADGSSFFDGLILDNATGIVDSPAATLQGLHQLRRR